MTNVFVAGAYHELGPVLVQQLTQRGHKVTAQTKGKVGADAIRAAGALPVYADSVRGGEMSSAMKFNKPDIVVNLIPQTLNSLLHDGAHWENAERFLRESTQAVLTASAANDVKFVIHTSFGMVYNGARHAVETTERRAPARNPQFKAAIDAENDVINHGIAASILRFGYVYGDTADMRAYRQSVFTDRPYFAGEERNQSMIYLHDAASALVLAAEKQAAGEVYNIADDTPVSFGTFIDTFCQLQGLGAATRLPLMVARLLPHLKASQFDLLNISATLNNTKAKTELGWSPQYPSYKDGLEHVLRLWRANGVS
jgi:nucleoside-diphosphate-sugar epimerase